MRFPVSAYDAGRKYKDIFRININIKKSLHLRPDGVMQWVSTPLVDGANVGYDWVHERVYARVPQVDKLQPAGL